MTVTAFAVKVSKHEGLKIELPIAQISEVLKIINKLTGGVLYALIKIL